MDSYSVSVLVKIACPKELETKCDWVLDWEKALAKELDLFQWEAV